MNGLPGRRSAMRCGSPMLPEYGMMGDPMRPRGPRGTERAIEGSILGPEAPKGVRPHASQEAAVCLHPWSFLSTTPRNPWLAVVEVQDSAAPFHDWNERIT